MLNQISLNLGLKLTATGRPARIVYNRTAQMLGGTAALFSSKYEVGKTRRQLNTLAAVNFFRQNLSQNSYTPLFPQVYSQSLRDKISVEKLINHYDAFFVDLYGVVENSSGVISQAIEALQQIAQRGKVIIFVSNTGDRLPETIAGKYEKMGLPISKEQIVTSGMMLRNWFEEKGLIGQKVINVGDEKVCAEYIRLAGTIPLPHENILQTYHEAKAVVIGFNKGFDEQVEIAALNALIKFNLPAAVTNTDEMTPHSANEIQLTTGSEAVKLEQYSRIKIDRLGKPSPSLYELAFKMAKSKMPKLQRERILVVGDALPYDILGAQNSGLDSLFVLSGYHQQLAELSNLEKIMISSETFPTFVLPTFG